MLKLLHLEFGRQAPIDRIWRDCLRPNSSVELRYLLRRHLWVMVASVLVSLSLAVLYVIKTPRLYTTHAQVLLDPRTPKPLPSTGDGEGAERTLQTPEIESQIEILKSTSIQAAVVNKYKLYSVPEFIADSNGPLRRLARAITSLFRLDKILTGAGAAADAPDPADVRAAINHISDGLNIERVKLSYLIDISFTSRDPQVSALISNAIAETYIEDQLSTNAKIATSGANWLEERIDQLRQKVNDASFKLQQFSKRPDIAPGQSGQTSLDELESTVAAYRKLFESYLEAFTDSAQRAALPTGIGRIVTTAEVPIAPSHPHIPKILAAAIILGLIAGYGIALAREYFDNTIRKPSQIENTGIAYLGELRGLNRGPRMRLVPDEPLSQFSYDLRRLEWNLSSARVPTFQSLGISSASAAMSSVEISCNLAYFYASAGKRVLLVDANFGSQGVSHAFALDAKEGLADVLRETSETHDCIITSAFHGVDLLPVGTMEEQQLRSWPFVLARIRARLLQTLEAYDVVIYDLPAALSPATLSMASLVDAVVILSEFGRTPMSLFSELATALQVDTGRFVGTAVSFDPPSGIWPIVGEASEHRSRSQLQPT